MEWDTMRDAFGGWDMKAETAHLGDSKVRITIFQFQFVFDIDDAPFLTKDFFSVVEIVDFHFASRSFPLTEQKRRSENEDDESGKEEIFNENNIYLFYCLFWIHRASLCMACWYCLTFKGFTTASK